MRLPDSLSNNNRPAHYQFFSHGTKPIGRFFPESIGEADHRQECNNAKARLDAGNIILYSSPMGTLYKQDGITIRVNGCEHPPIHAHVINGDGRALVYLSGRTLNRGVSLAALKIAQAWVTAHKQDIENERQRWN